MISIEASSISCGVCMMMIGVSDEPIKDLKLLVKGQTSRGHPLRVGQVYLFSDCVGEPHPNSFYQTRHGEILAELIAKEGCGDIWEVGPFKNPSSGNDIKLWAWRYGLRPSSTKPVLTLSNKN